MSAPSRTFTTTIRADSGGSIMCVIDVPLDPREVFGKARAPVVVKVGKHSYRSTICIMGGETFVPLRASNREAAGVEPGQRVKVTLTLDDQPRSVEAPRDLASALRRAGLWAAWKALSYTHQREHAGAIEEAKKPETRARRIEKCVAMLGAKAPARRAPRSKA